MLHYGIIILIPLLAEKSLFLSNFIASNGGFGAIQPTHKEVSYFAMQSHLIRHSNGITARAQLAAGLHKEWEEYAKLVLLFAKVKRGAIKNQGVI